MKAMAVADLEQMIEQGCGVPGCTHKEHTEIFLVQRCHPGAGVDASYTKGSGVVRILYHRCKQPVIVVAVALC